MEEGNCCIHHLRRHWNSSHTPYYTISMQAFSTDGTETAKAEVEESQSSDWSGLKTPQISNIPLLFNVNIGLA
jgi:hypothetical protein